MLDYLYRLIALLAGVGTVVFALSVFNAAPPGCEAPIRYSIGEIDSRFEIEEDEVQSIVGGAEEVWEEAVTDQIEHDLFVYDPSAEFSISFVYDERQQRTEQLTQAERELNEIESTHNEVSDRYETLAAQYRQERDDYEGQVSEYEADLATYNQDVRAINRAGGAPPQEHEELQERREVLEEREQQLRVRVDEIELLRQQVNQLATESNQIIREYNENVETFNQRFGESQRFSQGDYTPAGINIYQFRGPDDLRLVLAHELGHALSIEHVENPESIMYYLMGEQGIADPVLTSADVAALSQVCGWSSSH